MTLITEEEIYQKYGLIFSDYRMFEKYKIPMQYAKALKNTNLEECIKQLEQDKQNEKIVQRFRDMIYHAECGRLSDNWIKEGRQILEGKK
jgi:hypothetical protein